MGAWTLTAEGADATKVVLPVLRGTVTATSEQDDAITTSLDGTVTVWSSPAEPTTPSIPLCRFTHRQRYDLTRLEQLVKSRRVCILTTDAGDTYRVKCIGKWAPVLQDTTNRLVRPHWEIQLTFVGV